MAWGAAAGRRVWFCRVFAPSHSEGFVSDGVVVEALEAAAAFVEGLLIFGRPRDPLVLGLEDDGVHGHALHLHHAVVVKAGGLGEQVPLAKEGGIVAGFL